MFNKHNKFDATIETWILFCWIKVLDVKYNFSFNSDYQLNWLEKYDSRINIPFEIWLKGCEIERRNKRNIPTKFEYKRAQYATILCVQFLCVESNEL